MADVITRLKVESSEYDSKIKRATQSLNEMTTAAEKEGNKIATANQKNIAMAQSLGKMQTVATSARGKMSELSSAIESATLMYNRLSAAEKQGQFGRALNASITQLQGRLKGLQGEMAAVQRQMGKTSAASKGGFLNGIGGSFMGGASSSAMAALGPAAAGAAAVTVAFSGMKKVVGDMVQTNMQFEQSSSNLAAVMGKSRDEITNLTDQAKQLGATTQYTATQILELQANLARLGFTQQEILNSTKAVQAMATAMGADLGEAASLAGSALRGFGLQATEMERVASVLAVGTTKSALSFEKLATALPIVQTTAAKTGFTIEDTVAMLGKLTDNGINAASAATQLRKILNDATTDGTKLATALGGPVKSFDELVVALDKASKSGMKHADSVALVNSKNATALDILVQMASQREVDIDGVTRQTSALQDLRDEITGCAEAMQSMQDEQLNTLQGSITMLSSAWDGLMLTFSESNGVIKKVVDGFTELIGTYTKARNLFSNGGNSAVSLFEKGVTEDDKKNAQTLIQGYRAGGTSDDQIAQKLEQEKAELERQKEELQRQIEEAEASKSSGLSGVLGKAITGISAIGGVGGLLGGSQLADAVETKLSNVEDLYKQMAALNDKIAAQEYKIGLVTEAEPTDVSTEATDDGTSATLSTKRLATLKAQYEEEEKMRIASLDRMNMEEADYEARVYEIRRETLQKIADLYQDETAEKARANAAISQLDIAYQGTQMRLANKKDKTKPEPVVVPIEFDSKGLSALKKQLSEALSGADFGTQAYKDAASNLVDFETFSNLLNMAVKKGLDIDSEWMSSLFEDVKIGADVDDSTWQALLDNLNKQLQEKGLEPLKLDFETGNLEEIKVEVKTAFDEMRESLDKMSKGVGAISTIGNAFNDLKGIGDDLAEAFSGDMDTWDALMTVFNSGISIMQTVMGVMEAINTLTELSSALKKANTVATETEAATALTSAATEAGAEATKAGANMTTAGTAAAASSAEAGEAVAGIPIVGPILAVAAIAAVLAATFAAMSKAKSAGKSGGFATGGIVPGNSFSGDNLRTSDYGINSGELVLNKAQQSNLAGQLQSNPMGNLRLSTEISGTNLRIVMNNDNRSRGGQRGFYSEIH